MKLLHDLVQTFGALARSLGLLGVFALTLFDGSLLWLLPGINDIVLISFVIAKGTVLWAALAVAVATAGSMLGAMASYRIGHRGGMDLLRKRFPSGLLRRVVDWTQRMGAIPVGVAAVLPPPFPYAPFVFSAGIMQVRKSHFRISVAAGRGVRYSLDAVLALYLGRHLLNHPYRFYRAALEPMLVVVGIGLLAWGVVRLQLSRGGANLHDYKLW